MTFSLAPESTHAMKMTRKLSSRLSLVAAAFLLVLLAGCTAVSDEGEEYTPPPLPASSIGRLRPDANLPPE